MSNTNDATIPSPGGEGAGLAGAPARDGGSRAPDRRNRHRWVPVITGWFCRLIGLADIIHVIRLPTFSITHRVATAGHHLAHRLHVSHLHKVTEMVPGLLSTSNVSHTADVVIGLLLIMISNGLLRRKRRAWQAACVLLGFSVLIHVIHAPYLVPGVGAALALLVLLYFHDDFYAVGDYTSRWRAAGIIAGLLVADLAIGLSYIMLARHLAGNYSLWTRVTDVAKGLVGVSGDVRFVKDRDDLFDFLTSALGIFTLLAGGYLFFRSARPQSRLSEPDANRVRELLTAHGDRDSLGYFALRNDKSVIWSPSGKAGIGYRVATGVVLATGDPIGDPEAWPGAIAEFFSEAERHAWIPAVMGCSELGAEVWCRESDMTALEIGDEAVVDVTTFTIAGRPMRNVRQMVSRVQRQGYTAQVRRVAEIPPAEIAALARQAEDWRGSRTERGFSMALGRIGGPADGDCVIATASENGVLRGLLQFVPWGCDGLSLDLMRRDRAAQPGVSDFLIVESIRQAPELGIKRMSLNFALFRAALARGERIGAGPVSRLWRRVLLFFSHWFQIESLYKFNEKFSPMWVPRFFVFPGPKDGPRIALAALEAEAFVVWPRLRLRRLARRIGLNWLARRLGLAAVARRTRPFGVRGLRLARISRRRGHGERSAAA